MSSWYNATMEIYSQRTNRAYFDAPANSTVVTATAALNGGDSIALTVTAVASSRERHIDLPYIDSDGEVKVNWSFSAQTFDGMDNVVIVDTYEVVTPILSDREIKAIHPNATADETVAVERAVRHVIQAHTGQRFGRFVGNYQVRGNDSLTLVLPSRLLEITSVNGTTEDISGYFQIDADGWVLRHFPWGVPPVKADYFGLHQHVGGVIHNPNNVRLGEFYKTATYDIEGVWGFYEVPQSVREAAKLLVNDYACADAAYRDRYLTSMTAADWRLQFNSGAFANTGNVRADQLLAEHVLKRGWAII